jgi:hypothetical protein
MLAFIPGDCSHRDSPASIDLLAVQHVEPGEGERDHRLLVAGQLLSGHDNNQGRFGKTVFIKKQKWVRVA